MGAKAERQAADVSLEELSSASREDNIPGSNNLLEDLYIEEVAIAEEDTNLELVLKAK